MLHEPGHHLVYVAVDAQVSVAVMLGGLKVDDDQPAATALGGQWQVPTGPDLQGGAQRDGQVCVPAGLISKSEVPVGQGILPVQDGISQLPPVREVGGSA